MADLIDREKLKEAMCESCAEFDDCTMTWPCPMKEICLAMHTVDAQPTVDAEKHGRWISTQNPDWPAYWHNVCSECGWANMKNARIGRGKKSKALNFCPNCGARCD